MTTGISFEIGHLVINSDFVIAVARSPFPDRAQSPNAKCIGMP